MLSSCSLCSSSLPLSATRPQGGRWDPGAQQTPPAVSALRPPSHPGERWLQQDGRPQPGGVYRPDAAAAGRPPAGRAEGKNRKSKENCYDCTFSFWCFEASWFLGAENLKRFHKIRWLLHRVLEAVCLVPLLLPKQTVCFCLISGNFANCCLFLFVAGHKANQVPDWALWDRWGEYPKSAGHWWRYITPQSMLCLLLLGTVPFCYFEKKTSLVMPSPLILNLTPIWTLIYLGNNHLYMLHLEGNYKNSAITNGALHFDLNWIK